MPARAGRAAAHQIHYGFLAIGAFLRVDGVGAQGHFLIGDASLEQIEAMITDIAHAGFEVPITELDVDPLPRDEQMYGADLAQKTRMREETNIYADDLPPDKQDHMGRPLEGGSPTR